jgi:ABC-type transport system involved in cytochrome c biogenesis, permease component
MIFLFAPRETTMGDVQRIVYLHVAVAWCGLAGCVVMGLAAAAYLLRRDQAWDRWSQVAGELGWLCSTLTLATGSFWAHEAWNTWWTWEPRLTASLVLWTMFAGYFLVRASLDDAQRRARLSAVLAILALADIPLVVMATRWFRGIHPVTPEMDPRMRLVLLTSVVSFSALFVLLAILRKGQLDLAARLTACEHRSGIVT